MCYTDYYLIHVINTYTKAYVVRLQVSVKLIRLAYGSKRSYFRKSREQPFILFPSDSITTKVG